MKYHTIKSRRLRISILALFALIQADFYAQKIDSTKIIRVLTYNIYHGETVNAPTKFDLDLLARVINDTKPDVVALQEVDFLTNRARNLDLVTELGQRTKMAPLFGRAMKFDGGEYGEGILSRYSFLSTKNHPLVAQQGKEPRSALEINIIIKSGDTVRFVGTHLDHTRDATDRINQANQLNDLFTNNNKPTILAGDLNAVSDSDAMKILFKKWNKTYLSDIPTHPADKPTKTIDFILYRPVDRWRVIETTVIDEKFASDHLPVLSVLELLD